MSAGAALVAAARDALTALAELNGAYEARPQRAALPYATIEAGLENDWGHKSGEGREVRLTVTLHDGGESPARLRRIAGEAEAALAGLGAGMLPSESGWRIVSFAFLRSRIAARPEQKWINVLDYRARMLAL